MSDRVDFLRGAYLSMGRITNNPSRDSGRVILGLKTEGMIGPVEENRISFGLWISDRFLSLSVFYLMVDLKRLLICLFALTLAVLGT